MEAESWPTWKNLFMARCIACFIHQNRNGPVCEIHPETASIQEDINLIEELHKELLAMQEILSKCTNICGMLATLTESIMDGDVDGGTAC